MLGARCPTSIRCKQRFRAEGDEFLQPMVQIAADVVLQWRREDRIDRWRLGLDLGVWRGGAPVGIGSAKSAPPPSQGCTRLIGAMARWAAEMRRLAENVIEVRLPSGQKWYVEEALHG